MNTKSLLNDSESLLYRDKTLGEMAILPPGAIVDIGGVTGPNFTIGGKGVILSDGTTSDGSGSGGILFKPTTQIVYNNTAGEALTVCTSGKDIVWQATNGRQLRFDADTGQVDITGDLIVHGTTTTVIRSSIETDRVAIRAIDATYVPLIMEPQVGVVPVLDVVDIKVLHGGESVFRVDKDGETHITTIHTDKINDKELPGYFTELDNHLSLTAPGIRHTADQISAANMARATVQGVLELMQAQIIALQASSGLQLIEFPFTEPSTAWNVRHNRNTKKVMVTIYDENDEEIIPDSVKIADGNLIEILWDVEQAGRVVIAVN
ncbi:hypothetical protein [Janthinobacterium sp.]|uniref:hypothetical protein n=1 Tax=Janthinobacterium sp. TaxID=1871054 RepID=UPI0026296AA5|nr:hypothetical protein [Janthinobacterium sp.]